MKGLQRLMNVLDEEIRCYDRMKQHQRAEQKSILSRNFDGIDENVLNIERLCWHIESLERERENAVADLSMSSSRKSFPRGLTLAELTEQVQGPEKSTLCELSEKLSELLNEVQTINHENSFLLGRSLESVSEILGTLLTEITETNIAYTHQGRPTSHSVGMNLINRTA